MAVQFSTRTLGGQLMRFNFNVLNGGATTRGHSEISVFRTTQPKTMMIPTGPKSLLGWAQYKKFAAALTEAVRAVDPLTEAVRAVDPSAQCEFVERPA